MNELLLSLAVRIQALVAREEGQDLVEYAMIVGLITLALVTSLGNVATTIATAFTNIATTIS